MTDSETTSQVPFWRRKRLQEMTESEWESLCDGCGRCCLAKVSADDSRDVYTVDVGCELLDPASGRCSDYANRLTRDVGCWKMTPAHVPDMAWMPPTCGYRRVFLGQQLDWWHPLVSGDPDTVHKAGMSAAGRFIRPRHAGPLEYHTVDWPSREATGKPRDRWQTAQFGGVNASVPTPFGPDGCVDLDLMAEHCLWLLANGCHGLAVLDKAGEVASLAVGERIAVIAGLVSRGVPASKLLAGIGPASLADSMRIVAGAERLGVRGAMLTASAAARSTPRDVLPVSLQALMQHIGASLHLYLSISAGPAATASWLTALEAFAGRAPGRLKGIRDEADGCPLGLAALERFDKMPFEVYAADDTALAKLARGGGAGLIGPRANLHGRLCARVMDATEKDPVSKTQAALEAVRNALRPRPSVPAIKALLGRHAGNPGWDRTRHPLRPPTPVERTALYKAFDATGIRLRPIVEPVGPPCPNR